MYVITDLRGMSLFVNAFIVIFVDLCDLPSETGYCRASIPSWYYDSGEGRCKTFIYGGCGGNANRFATKDACQQRCGKGKFPEPDQKLTCRSVFIKSSERLFIDPGFSTFSAMMIL